MNGTRLHNTLRRSGIANAVWCCAKCDQNVFPDTLERAVVDAAIRFKLAETAVWVENEVGTTESAEQAKAERPRAYIAFVEAVDALLIARKRAENSPKKG